LSNQGFEHTRASVIESFRLKEEDIGRIVEIVPSVMLRFPDGNKKIWARASGLADARNIDEILPRESRL